MSSISVYQTIYVKMNYWKLQIDTWYHQKFVTFSVKARTKIIILTALFSILLGTALILMIRFLLFQFKPTMQWNPELFRENVPYSKLTSIEQDPHVLLNMTDFKFLHNYWDFCDQNLNHTNQHHHPNGNDTSAPPLPQTKIFLIIVQTTRGNQDERKVIRKTWGSMQPRDGNWSVRVLFLMGVYPYSGYKSINDDPILSDEFGGYADVIVGNFMDTSKNLSYKALAGLRWALEFCHEADFVILTKDSVFVDVDRLVEYRKEDLAMKQGSKNNFYCGINRQTVPVRCSGCDYFVGEDEFPGPYFPDYCSGIGYGLTMDLIRKLYSVSRLARFVWVADVFVTGILMQTAHSVYTEKSMEVVHRDLWNKDITTEVKEYTERLCEMEQVDWAATPRYFKTIVVVEPGDNFERYMKCLWNKTMIDIEAKVRVA